MEKEERYAFKNRAEFVAQADGFIPLDFSSPSKNHAEIHPITYWESYGDFESWNRFYVNGSHKDTFKGLKLVPNSWELSKYEDICS